MFRWSRGIGWAILIGGLAAASGSWGQSAPTPTQTTLAESLFEEGQALMAAGRYPEACPKLAESHRLDPASGTVLNLAVCHERQGRVATAWAEYRDALVYATREGRAEREQLASDRIAALEPILPRLVVAVTATGSGAGLVVKVDGVDVGPAAWGTELPLDPGSHVVTATAPGRQGFAQSIALQVSQKLEVVVPALGAVRRNAVPPGPPAPDVDPNQGRRTTGYLLGGGGLLALGVGGFFGVRAIVNRKDSDARCDPLCDDEAVRLNDNAKRDARIADIGLGLGVVGVAAGAYLLLTTPGPAVTAKAHSASLPAPWRVTPAFAPGSMGMTLGRRW